MIFNRSNFNELWITLTSNEVLGILDSNYLEDYFGVGGQISIYHIEDDTYYPVLMNEIEEATPSIQHDVFTGFYELNLIPSGHYEVRGRVKDVIGNYTILSAVEYPFGGERIISLTFEVTNDEIIVNFIVVKMVLGINFIATLKNNFDIINVIQKNIQLNNIIADEKLINLKMNSNVTL